MCLFECLSAVLSTRYVSTTHKNRMINRNIHSILLTHIFWILITNARCWRKVRENIIIDWCEVKLNNFIACSRLKKLFLLTAVADDRWILWKLCMYRSHFNVSVLMLHSFRSWNTHTHTSACEWHKNTIKKMCTCNVHSSVSHVQSLSSITIIIFICFRTMLANRMSDFELRCSVNLINFIAANNNKIEGRCGFECWISLRLISIDWFHFTNEIDSVRFIL